MRKKMGILMLITGILIAPDIIYAQNAGDPVILGKAPNLSGIPSAGGLPMSQGHSQRTSHWDKPGEHGNFLDFAIEHFETGQDSVLPIDSMPSQHGIAPVLGGHRVLPGLSKDPSSMPDNPTHVPHGQSVHGGSVGHAGEMLGSAVLTGAHGDLHGSQTWEFGMPLGSAAVHPKKTSVHLDPPGKHGNFLDIPVEHVVVDQQGPLVDQHTVIDQHGKLPAGIGEVIGGANIHLAETHVTQGGGFGEPIGAAAVHATKKSSHWDPPGQHGNFLDIPVEHVVVDPPIDPHGPHPVVEQHDQIPFGVGELIGGVNIHGGFGEPLGTAAVHAHKKTSHWDPPGKHGNILDIPVEHVVPDPEPQHGTQITHGKHSHSQIDSLNPILADFGKLISEPVIDGLHGTTGASSSDVFGEPIGTAAIHGKKTTSHFDMPGQHGNFLDIPVEHVGPHPIQSEARGLDLPGTIDSHSQVQSKATHVDILSGQIDITKPKLRISGNDYMSSLTQGYGRSRTKPVSNVNVPNLSPVIDNAVIRNPIGMSIKSPVLETHSVKSVVPNAVVDPTVHLPKKVSNMDTVHSDGKTLMDRLANSYSRIRARANNRPPFLQTPMMSNVMKTASGLSGLAQDILSPLSAQVASIAGSMQSGTGRIFKGKHMESMSSPTGLLHNIDELAKKQTRGFHQGNQQLLPARPRPSNPEMMHLSGPKRSAQFGLKQGVAGLQGELPIHQMIGGQAPMPEPLPIYPIIDGTSGVPEPEPLSEPGPSTLSKKERRKLKKEQNKQRNAAKRQNKLASKLRKLQEKHAATNKDKFKRKIKKVTRKLAGN